MRKVKFKSQVAGMTSSLEREGFFHCWGIQGGETIGIIEGESGSIYVALPVFIDFIEPYKNVEEKIISGQ